MKKLSVAKRNVIILILSLMPFIIGISVSVANSSDMQYFGVAINISGSQRMRTMLIANYAQQIEDKFNENDLEHLTAIKQILSDELLIYQRFMNALVNGNPELNMKKNNIPDIVREIKLLRPQFTTYLDNANNVLINPNDEASVDYIVKNSLALKNKIHKVVEMYQKHYDKDVIFQKTLDISMIAIAILVTGSGLLLTRIISHHEYHANYDFLTKLQNRLNLYEYIKDESPTDFSIFFIDLNKFKIINDTFGHAIGDEILIEVSDRLRTIFNEDTLYRYGGDEFIALNKSITGDNSSSEIEVIDTIVKRLEYELTKPIIDSQNREHFIGLSMGVVASTVGIDDWDSLINFADELMYDSKSFTGHVIICTEKEDALNRINLSHEIENAFETGTIQPHLQSIYNASNERIELYLALARWHYKGRIIKPSEFLPLIKRKGLSSQLDKYMIQYIDGSYKKMVLANPDNAKKLYTVNITEDSLLRATSNGLFEVLESIEMPKDKLVLKFMEEVLVNENILETIHKLDNMGFTLAVDNFTIDISLKESTKYKNIKIVKLGKTIVGALMLDDYSKKILKEFIKMLISIEKVVIVEGLQLKDELVVLKSINSELTTDLLYTAPFTVQNIKELEQLKI